MDSILDEAALPTGIRNPLDRLLGYQMRRASAAIMADLTASLADLALKPTDASVLQLIGANPDITQSEIGRVLGIQRANMAPLMGALIARDLVQSTKADGRSQALRLTPSGIILSETCRARITAHEARFLPSLPISARVELIMQLNLVWSVPLDMVKGRG